MLEAGECEWAWTIPVFPQPTRGKGTSRQETQYKRINAIIVLKAETSLRVRRSLIGRRWGLNSDPENKEQLCKNRIHRVPDRRLVKDQVGRERIWESGNNSPYLKFIVQESKMDQGVKGYLVFSKSTYAHDHTEVHSVMLSFLSQHSSLIISANPFHLECHYPCANPRWSEL